MWEKNNNKGTTKCDKSKVTCDVVTAQYVDGTIKCEEKNWTTKYDKSTVKCDVGTAEYDNGTFKCEKKKKEPPNLTKE